MKVSAMVKRTIVLRAETIQILSLPAGDHYGKGKPFNDGCSIAHGPAQAG
jgi:hypothetical protein